MGPRSLLVWSVAAVVATAGAVYVSLDRPAAVAEAQRVDEPVFTALRAAPETAALVSVAHGGDEVRIERTEAGWVVPSRYGYAADEATVRALMTGLADLRWAGPRTALEERYARLEVDAPGAGSAAKRVTVTAGDGTVLVDAVIGKRSQAIRGSERGTYLRLVDGERAWLARGVVEVPTEPVDWLATDLPSLARDALKSVTVAPAGGEAFTVGRTAPADDMTLAVQLPADRTGDAAAIRRLAAVFAGLRFEDLRPAAAVDWPEGATRLEGTSFDDETLALELATLEEGERWVRFADEPDWIYRLPDFQTDRLDIRLADLVRELEAS